MGLRERIQGVLRLRGDTANDLGVIIAKRNYEIARLREALTNLLETPAESRDEPRCRDEARAALKDTR
jgi:hypothetical protein